MVRTRIAPSPTGFPHIGTIFQALINYAIAKNAKPKGQFIVRIEDTDRNRYVKGAEEAIFEALEWFGLIPDESPKHGGPYPPYRQSEKLPRYKERAQWLVEQKKAYYCFCSPEDLEQMRKQQQAAGKPPMYDGRCRTLSSTEVKERIKKESYVIRMKIIYDKSTLDIRDDIRGIIQFKTELIDDQVILKSDKFPTYHLAVVVDDHDMEITQVIRGEEWISSTPKHVLLRQYFGWDDKPLSYLHTPLLRNPDGSKLSKRHSHAAVSWYKKQGFLPEAILNYLANLVYNHPKGEIFTLEEFVKSFTDRTKIHSVGARFNIAKLEWLNGEYIRESKVESLKSKVFNFYERKYDINLIAKTIPLIQERIKKLSDYLPLCEFFFTPPQKYETDLSSKQNLLHKIHDGIEKTHDWRADSIGEHMQVVAKENNVKASEFFMVLRVAITGKKISPPLNESMEILGKTECLDRIKNLLAR